MTPVAPALCLGPSSSWVLSARAQLLPPSPTRQRPFALSRPASTETPPSRICTNPKEAFYVRPRLHAVPPITKRLWAAFTRIIWVGLAGRCSSCQKSLREVWSFLGCQIRILLLCKTNFPCGGLLNLVIVALHILIKRNLRGKLSRRDLNWEKTAGGPSVLSYLVLVRPSPYHPWKLWPSKP